MPQAAQTTPSRTTTRATAPKTPASSTPSAATDVVPTPPAAPREISPEERYSMIATAAYFRAQSRGFAPGHEVQDWLDAQAEVDGELARRTKAAHQAG